MIGEKKSPEWVENRKFTGERERLFFGLNIWFLEKNPKSQSWNDIFPSSYPIPQVLLVEFWDFLVNFRCFFLFRSNHQLWWNLCFFKKHGFEKMRNPNVCWLDHLFFPVTSTDFFVKNDSGSRGKTRRHQHYWPRAELCDALAVWGEAMGHGKRWILEDFVAWFCCNIPRIKINFNVSGRDLPSKRGGFIMFYHDFGIFWPREASELRRYIHQIWGLS